MKLLALLQAKAIVTIVASVLLVGGATAAFAATPTGQTVVQSLTHASSTVTVKATPGEKQDSHQATATSDKDQSDCPGQADAQNLAIKYGLSSDSKGKAVQAICTLHQGTFTSKTTSNITVTVSHVYGYGEIDQLLTYAQYLAAHDAANTGSKLTDTNVSSYLADALKICGDTPVEKCVTTNIPGFQPGDGNKPTETPTPHSNKPPVTPTPDGNNGNKPTGTPTPHH